MKNDWEINLSSNSTIESCLHDEHSIANHNFIFTPINELPTLINNFVVDIIGVVICISPLVTITRKNGMETHKRTLQLRDMSSYSIEVTLWGVLWNKYNLEQYATINSFPIIAIKVGKITDFNKISITTTFSSQLYINLDLKETWELRTWFEKPGTDLQCYSLSAHGASGGHHSIHKNLPDIQTEGIGIGVDPSYILVEATIASMDTDNCWYVACSLTFEDRKCKKNSHLLRMVYGSVKGAINTHLNVNTGTFSNSTLKTTQGKLM